MTSPFCGGRGRKALGRCTIILVIGVRLVIPTPLMRSLLFGRSEPVATMVAILSRRTWRGVNCCSYPSAEMAIASEPRTRIEETAAAGDHLMRDTRGLARQPAINQGRANTHSPKRSPTVG